MSSFLDDTFLGAPAEDITTQVGSAGNLPPMAEQRQLAAPKPQTITLPGGIVMPRSTAIALAILLVGLAIWYYKSRKKG